jgi:hypothetical protein
MQSRLIRSLPLYLSALACFGLASSAHAQASQVSGSSGNSWTMAVENDLFAGSHRDADYTGGFLFTLSGPTASSAWLSLDRVLGAIDSLWLPDRGSDPSSKAGLQFGLQAWTPNDTDTSAPIYDDRPYASLISWTSTRMTVGSDSEPAYASSLTIGFLGASFAKDAHKGVHKLFGNGSTPQGYSHQISDGGEPTLMYALRRQSLLGSGRLGDMSTDFKWGVGGSVGYITEATLSASGRIGRFSTPWWSMSSENTAYFAPHGSAGDLYLSYGVNGKLRGYNVLLQGQFRDSDVTFNSDEVEPLIGEGWFAVTWGITNSCTLSYLMRYQTADIKHGTGSRDYGSGGIYFNYGY